MKSFRTIYFIGALYELIRIGALFTLSIGIITPDIDQVYILFLMVLAAPGFILFAGFLFLGIYPEKYGVLTKLLAIGKLAGMFPVLFAALNSIGVLSFESAKQQLDSLGLLFGIIILFDFLFFLFLVSYRKRAPKNLSIEPAPELPKMDEVELEE